MCSSLVTFRNNIFDQKMQSQPFEDHLKITKAQKRQNFHDKFKKADQKHLKIRKIQTKNTLESTSKKVTSK